MSNGVFLEPLCQQFTICFIPAIIVVDEIKAWPRALGSTSNKSAAMNIKKTFIMLIQMKLTHTVSCSINILGNCTQITKTHLNH